MAEIEIIIERSGVSKAQITTEQDEDPACLTFDRLIQAIGDMGVQASNIRADERVHGHAHDYVQHKH